MSNINTKTYVDIHTTGKRQEFSSIKQYDKFLKEHNAYVVTKQDVAKFVVSPNENKEPPKSDYKKVAEQAWREREKFVQETKYGKRRLNAV